MICLPVLLLSITVALSDEFTRNLLTIPCDEAFVVYQEKFEKKYESEAALQVARTQFCSVHYSLQKADFSHADFRFNNESDKRLPVMNPHVHNPDAFAHESRTAANHSSDELPKKQCPWWYNSGSDPLQNLTVPLPRSYDLREKGLVGPTGNQGACGCCWAFASNAVLTSLVARQTLDYRANANYSEYFGYGISRSYLSVGYLVMATGTFCAGGTYGTTVSALQSGQMPTVELELDFPFKFGGGVPADKTIPPPIIPETAYLVPFQSFFSKEHNCHWVEVSLNTGKVTFDEPSILRIKSYLARGIAILTTVSIYTSDTSGGILGSYHSGYLNIPCVNTATDHAISYVGYGTLNGTEVWILRNSWGGGWGILGYVYFEQGSDSICSERIAVTSIPKYMDLNDTAVYVPNKYTDFIYKDILVRGMNGLDMDCDAGYYPNITKCVPCTIYDKMCSSCNKTQCVECAPDYYLTSDAVPSCASCGVRNCAICNEYSCCSCLDGYQLVNGVCVKSIYPKL